LSSLYLLTEVRSIILDFSIIKTIQANWQLFNAAGIDIVVAYGVSIYLFYVSLKELIYFKKHKKINHGADERNIRVLDKSLRNVSIVSFIIIMGAYYYFSIYNKADKLLFSLVSFNYLLVPAVIVFFLSFNYYYKQKAI